MLPSIGPFESDRTSLGTGVLLSAPLFEAVVGGRGLADGLSGFVAIDLAPGRDPAAFLADIRADLPGWDPFGVAPPSYAKPVRPATVVDVASSRRVPAFLTLVLILTMAVSVVSGIASGTRARRRELAVLRAMGIVPRQVRASVRWHDARRRRDRPGGGTTHRHRRRAQRLHRLRPRPRRGNQPDGPAVLVSFIVLGAVVLAMVARQRDPPVRRVDGRSPTCCGTTAGVTRGARVVLPGGRRRQPSAGVCPRSRKGRGHTPRAGAYASRRMSRCAALPGRNRSPA